MACLKREFVDSFFYWLHVPRHACWAPGKSLGGLFVRLPGTLEPSDNGRYCPSSSCYFVHLHCFPVFPRALILSSKNFKMSIYNCDSCKDDIPEKKARIYCHYCRDNYCANCFVVQKFLGAHKNSHPTMILNFSGVVLEHAPAAMPPRPKASIAARHGTQTYEAPVLPARIQTAPVLQTGAKRYPSVETIQVPTANWGALMPVMRGFLKSKKKEAPISEHIPKPAPLPKDNPIIDTSVADIVKQEYSLPQEVPLPTSPEKDEQEADFPPECWEPMFSSDGTPQPIFVSLMSELFSSLDPKSEGSLSPEQYSAYLEVQGVDTADNICMSLVPPILRLRYFAAMEKFKQANEEQGKKPSKERTRISTLQTLSLAYTLLASI